MFEAHPPKLGSWSEPNNQKLFQSPHMVPCWKLKAAMSFLHLSVASSEGFTVDIGFVTGASFVIFCFSLAFWAPLISHNESLIRSLVLLAFLLEGLSTLTSFLDALLPI